MACFVGIICTFLPSKNHYFVIFLTKDGCFWIFCPFYFLVEPTLKNFLGCIRDLHKF